MNVKLNTVDAVEFAARSLGAMETTVAHWGFEKLVQGQNGSTKQSLWGQGQMRLILSEGIDSTSYAHRFVEKHGDGICNVWFEVDDAQKALEITSKKGAKVLSSTQIEKVGGGEIHWASIEAVGDVVHSFISRHQTKAFSKTLQSDRSLKPQGCGMFAIDHMTVNLPAGALEATAAFYERIFGFKETRFFNISTGRTGLLSKVMENPEGTVKMPLNEPSDKKSQIQEYIDMNHGPGIQHLAMSTANIVETLTSLKKEGEKFLEVPDTYYDKVPSRIKGLKEDLNDLKRNRILADGDNSGYLLQIFSQNVVGPFFYEVIQRAGNRGFGEGNFQALFEAIERDQELRGVL